MRAATYAGQGGPEMIVLRDDVPEPDVGTDDALVEVAFAGLNRADVLERQGSYLMTRSGSGPTVPGMEFSGVVVTTGSRVTNVRAGDRVCGLVQTGAHAERLAVNAHVLCKVPPEVSLCDAAAIPEAFITAHDGLFTRGGFKFGEFVLVHAVGSSVGLAAVALAKRGGGVTLGTSRTPAKLERAQDHGLDFGFVLDDGWRAHVQVATNARGADVILDFVGAPMLDANLGVLAQGGRIVQIGSMGGAQAHVHLGLLMAKRAALHGTVLRTRALEEKIALAKHFERALLPLFARGQLRATVDRVFPLAELAPAHEYMENNSNFGKIVIEVGSNG